jgi:hypothetical protein
VEVTIGDRGGSVERAVMASVESDMVVDGWRCEGPMQLFLIAFLQGTITNF